MADYIEPNRDFDGVDKLRKLAYEDLDEAMALGLEMSLEDIKAMGRSRIMLLPTHISGIQSIPRKSNNGRGADLEGEIICSYSEAKRAASIQTAAEITAARITAARPRDTTIMITMQRASRARILRSRPIRLRAGKTEKRRARPEGHTHNPALHCCPALRRPMFTLSISWLRPTAMVTASQITMIPR